MDTAVRTTSTSLEKHACRLGALLLALALPLFGAPGCTTDNPNYCDANRPCKDPTHVCDVPTKTCLPPDSGALTDLTDVIGSDASTDDTSTDDVSTDDASPDSSLADAPPTLLENGAPCAEDAPCESQHCVDGVCCAGLCDGVCQYCATAGKEGQCLATTEGTDPRSECKGDDPTCGGSCDGGGACLFAEKSVACGDLSCSIGILNQGRCDGAGACEQEDLNCGGYTCADATSCRSTCDTAAHCLAPNTCDPTDSACKSNQPNGVVCGTNASLCQSGYCVDGVCCAAASCSECNACNIAGKAGSCAPIAGGVSCGANKSCTLGLAKLWTCQDGSCAATTTTPCAPFICNSGGTMCTTTCNPGECAPGAYCASASGLCVPLIENGQTCEAPGECKSTHCVDDVCCGSASCPECNACNMSGKEGRCAPIATGTGCGTGQTCDAGIGHDYACLAGTCEDTPTSCAPYTCGATGCKTTCASNTDCESSAYCNVSSKTCFPKKDNGVSCTAADQCQTGICTSKEGVCCNTACSGDCDTCTGKTACEPLPSGTSCGAGEICRDYTATSRIERSTCGGSFATGCQTVTYWECGAYRCENSTKCWEECVREKEPGKCIPGMTCVTKSSTTRWGTLVWWACE
ncbi:MAG: hypothetical protein JRH20_17530 [Deltaproteobacteria bacterium]|nr:hypothetical protein [Deltaproteobacteria bacterium]